MLVLGSASALFPLREHRELQVLRLPNCICILSMECMRISQSVLKLLGMRPCLEPYLWQKCRLILSVESGRASTALFSMMGYVNNTTHPHYVYVKISAHHCRVGLLQCRKDFSNLSEAIVHAAIVPLSCGGKVNRFWHISGQLNAVFWFLGP